MQIQSIIDGARHPAPQNAERLPIECPADESVYGELIEADPATVDAAVAAARRAFDSGPWRRAAPADRQALLHSIAALIDAHADELAALECRDAGLPLADVRSRHLPRAAGNFRYFADLIGTETGEVIEHTPGYLTVVSREPAGVAALLAPWNAPLALASMKVAAAISGGNSCVLKPSEHTPVSLARLTELLHEAGLPNGVVNLVNGRGPVTGQALAAHAGVDRVAFTGGTATGRQIMQAAAGHLTPVMLELGGKSANILFDTADIDTAVNAALLGIYSNNGQQCLAGSRILVQRPLLDEFLNRFVERSRALTIGDPADAATELGPLAYRGHYERVLGYADIARADGATIVTGGERAEGFDKGYYVQPTACLVESNRARVAREEIFGPFACILPFDDVDEAIAIANDSPFGLVAYAWTSELAVALKVRRELRAGTVWINSPLMRELHAPFGGYKHSGIGRSGGREGHLFYSETKTTSLHAGDMPLRELGRG
ncbi:MAG: aldehyde dehydrogenase [Pseudomonadota bacterium]